MAPGQDRSYQEWSIGIMAGESPLSLRGESKNSVLTARDVADVDAWFVADLFLLPTESGWSTKR